MPAAAAPPAAPAAPAAPAPAAPAAPKAGAPTAPAAPAPDPFAESFGAMDKFTQPEKGLPPGGKAKPMPPGRKNQQRAQEQPPAPDPDRPGQQGVNDPTEEELEEAQPPKPPPEEKPEETEQTPPKPQDDKEPRVDEKGQRKDPWKLVDNYRARYREAMRELDEVRGKASGTNGEMAPELKTKFEALEKRNAELENEIGFTNYRKSKEFVEQYERPFQTAWTEAMQALEGLKVSFQQEDPETGEMVSKPIRDFTSDDLTILARMKPEDARNEMKARFPEDWAEVKMHVDKVRSLSNAQNKALEERQSKGGEWMKAQQEQRSAALQNMVAENKKTWGDIITEEVKKYEFLRPVDGQEERNGRLEKAMAFVEDALKVNAMDPRLSPEQRREVLKKHVALRNRAIGFSVLNHENRTLKARVAELEKSLKQYESSEPGAGDGRGREGLPTEASTLDQAAAGLLKYTK